VHVAVAQMRDVERFCRCRPQPLWRSLVPQNALLPEAAVRHSGIDNWLCAKCQFSGCFAAVPHRAAFRFALMTLEDVNRSSCQP
jgi:hypothetical protein